MVCAVTFIATPGAADKGRRSIESAIQMTTSLLGAPTDSKWLHDKEAVQLLFPARVYANAKKVVKGISGLHGLDHCVSPHLPVPPKLFLADMEATIIKQEMVDLLGAELDCGHQITELTKRAMEGNLDFELSLHARTQYLKGVNTKRLQELKSSISYMPGAKTLVKTMSSLGAECVLVSGGYDVFAEHVATVCGFDHHFSNHLEVENDVLTGKVVGPVFDARAKQAVLESRCLQQKITLQEASAIGDGANDVNMLETCGLSASFQGKPVLMNLVDLSIVHGDLTAVLFAHGVKKQDFSENTQ